jgi:hypothetical protein
LLADAFFCSQIFTELNLTVMEKNKEFYENPEKYLRIDEAFEVLTERGNFSKETAFGEMHGDGYMWIVQHESVKVIVNQEQSFCYIYIDDGDNFHIRGLEYDGYYPSFIQSEFKRITVDKFKKQGFKPSCPDDGNKRFDAFTYGDGRDIGYVLSVKYSRYGTKCEYVNDRTIWGIRNMENWSAYLENPENLE